MRKVYSKDTGKEMFGEPDSAHPNLNTDVDIQGDGEGGIHFMACWHKKIPMGSLVIHWTRGQAEDAIALIKKGMEEID